MTKIRIRNTNKTLLKDNYSKEFYFNDNGIKITKDNNSDSINILYSDISRIDISLFINKEDINPTRIFRYGTDVHIIFCTHIKIQTNDQNCYEIIECCPIQTIYKIINLKQKIKNFNLQLSADNSIKELVSIPIFLYCISGYKFIINDKYFGMAELISTYILLFYVLFICQIINSATVIFDFIFFYLVLFPAIVCSFYILRNEYYKKIIVKRIYTINMKGNNYIQYEIEPQQSTISIIENNITFAPPNYNKYLEKVNYIGILSILFTLGAIAYTTIKLIKFLP